MIVKISHIVTKKLVSVARFCSIIIKIANAKYWSQAMAKFTYFKEHDGYDFAAFTVQLQNAWWHYSL